MATNHVSISINTNGCAEQNVKISNMLDIDTYCSDIAGLIGCPYEFTCSSDFNQAVVSISLNKNMIDKEQFDNIIVLWYDKQNDEFVQIDSHGDFTNGVIEFETSHFSSR